MQVRAGRYRASSDVANNSLGWAWSLRDTGPVIATVQYRENAVADVVSPSGAVLVGTQRDPCNCS
jgi:hypothetical protein